MDKQYFVLYLLPSRPDFAQTMTDEERGIMMKHVAYWTAIMNQGKVLAFGRRAIYDRRSFQDAGHCQRARQ